MGAPISMLLVLFGTTIAFASDCECLGNNDLIPPSQQRYYGTDYGKWCNAWDSTYGYCSAEKILSRPNRACWCPAQWCYVSSSCESATESIFSTEVNMYFSYATCANSADVDQCWDDSEGIDTSSVYVDGEDVTFGTRTKRSKTVKLTDLGPAETQNWDSCYITSCMWWGVVDEAVGAAAIGEDYNIDLTGAEQSSNVNSEWTADKATDHNTNGWINAGSCMHTNGDGDQWWRAQFAAGTHTVTRVQLWNRRDCCGDRTNNLKIKIGRKTCVRSTSGAGQYMTEYRCEGGPVTGDYIEIQSSTYINICEVTVKGFLATEEMEAIASTDCKIKTATHEENQNKYYQVETQPNTVGIVRCLRGDTFGNEVQWMSAGKTKGVN